MYIWNQYKIVSQWHFSKNQLSTNQTTVYNKLPDTPDLSRYLDFHFQCGAGKKQKVFSQLLGNRSFYFYILIMLQKVLMPTTKNVLSGFSRLIWVSEVPFENYKLTVRTLQSSSQKLETLSKSNHFIKIYTGILVLLCFALLNFTGITLFTNRRFVATLLPANPLSPCFQKHLLTSCVCHILFFPQYFKLFFYFIYYGALWWCLIVVEQFIKCYLRNNWCIMNFTF